MTEHPAPQRTLIGSRAELAQAIATLMAQARRELRCCAHDGSVFGLATQPVAEALGVLLRAHRHAQVRVLVDEPLWLEAQAPRFKLLQRRFSHAVQVRQASSEDPVAGDMQLFADDRHLLQLKAGVLTTGELWINNQPRARMLLVDFERRWAAAAHNLPVAPLGL